LRLFEQEAAAGRVKTQSDRELLLLRDFWLKALLEDPYYSPVLALNEGGFTGLAWPPRDAGVRLNGAPKRDLCV
jgi:hypothetical protein